MKHLAKINKATASFIMAMLVMGVNKWAHLGMDGMEQGVATAGLVALIVYLVPNYVEQK